MAGRYRLIDKYIIQYHRHTATVTFALLAAGVGSELLALQHQVTRLGQRTHLSVTLNPLVLRTQSQGQCLHPLVLGTRSQGQCHQIECAARGPTYHRPDMDWPLAPGVRSATNCVTTDRQTEDGALQCIVQ